MSEKPAPPQSAEPSAETTATIDGTGHAQQLDRNFNLWSIISVGAVVGNAWPAFGGTILVAIFNGGPPGVIYEFITVSIFYFFVAACIAELASAMPSSAGVYHWASVTAGPKYGRICGFFAGWWNFFAWVFGGSSTGAIIGNQILQMYALYHPGFEVQNWHIFIVYIIVTWSSSFFVLFGNRILPAINKLGLFFVLTSLFITIVVCAAMPGTGGRVPHATNDFVWRDWSADTGYTSQGFVFLMGMLNGAFAIGTPDCVSHLAEEIPYPEKNIPKAIAAQMSISLVTTLGFMVAIFYATNDLDSVLTDSGNFPLAQIYFQATSSPAGAVGLLVLIFLPFITCMVGVELTASRTLWTLARDGATPFPSVLGSISARWRNPFWAQVATTCLITVLGCLYVGSTTAFNALVGSFVIFSTASYAAAILPNLLNRRRYVKPGPFYMNGVLADVMMVISCAYIIIFIVIYCFPFSLPVTASNMNYSSLIFGGITAFMALWWLIGARKGYRGPAINAQEAGVTYFEGSHKDKY